MGYELHIIRKGDYESIDEDSNITLDEWLKYVETDEELNLTNGYSTEIPNVIDIGWTESLGYCEWIGHPRADANTIPWFAYGHGSISTKYPDKFTIGKMIRIAQVFNEKSYWR